MTYGDELAADRVGDDGAVGAHRRARSSTRDGSESDEGDDGPELECHFVIPESGVLPSRVGSPGGMRVERTRCPEDVHCTLAVFYASAAVLYGQDPE